MVTISVVKNLHVMFRKDLLLDLYVFLFISMIFLKLYPNNLFLLFADDSNIYFESENLKQRWKVVNNELKCTKNGLMQTGLH